ncbi:hypothetical protein Tco_1469501 [Tanacetum coccineum]
MFVSVLAGPWDHLFRGENLPAFIVRSISAAMSGILAFTMLSSPPSDVVLAKFWVQQRTKSYVSLKFLLSSKSCIIVLTRNQLQLLTRLRVGFRRRPKGKIQTEEEGSDKQPPLRSKDILLLCSIGGVVVGIQLMKSEDGRKNWVEIYERMFDTKADSFGSAIANLDVITFHRP